MSNYIDERPFEQIVRETVLDGKHEEFIDCVVSVVLNDEQSNWRTNSYKNDQTIYDFELYKLTRKQEALKSNYEQVDKHYTSVLAKVAALDVELGSSNEDDEEEEEEYYDDDDDYYQEKGAAVKIQAKANTMKPAELAAKRKRDELASRNFKATLATLQEELREMMKEMRELEDEIKKNTYYQDISAKTIRTLYRISKDYRVNKDIEYVKKGAYFVKDYSDKLYARYNPII